MQAQFLVPYWGVWSRLLGCRTGPPGYIGWPTTLCRSRLYPPHRDSGLKSGTNSLSFQYLLDHYNAHYRGGPEVNEYSLEPVPWETVQQPASPCKHHLQATGTASIHLQIHGSGLISGCKENRQQDIFVESTYIRAKVKYGVGSPKFIWAPCHVMCLAVLIGWDPVNPPSPSPSHILYTRGAIG